MTTYNVYSAKDQGCYKKDELIRKFKSDNLDKTYGFKGVDISKITIDGNNRVYIKESA